ncbi:MAG TPA: hypothetical protein PK066_13500 [Saprospiraceae bacterium]|nr:hypothetical protein [Saprospiraceae bacterium]
MKNLYALIAALLVILPGFSQQPITIKGEELYGGLRGRHIGPALMSGRISRVTGHPKDSKIIYVGAAGGGVWRSVDAGVTFSSIFDKYAQSIGAIAVDPTDPDQTIWVGTGETWTRNSVSVGDGIYKSTNGGQTWNKMGLEKSEHIASIQVDPSNHDIVYVAVMGALWGDSEERGVYKTIDGGKTWSKILYVNETTGCSDLAMDPRDPKVLYAAFWEFRRTAWSFSSGGASSALYKSEDGGQTWNKIHNGFPAGQLGRFAIGIAPSNPDIVYAVVEAEKAEDKGLYRSDDAGQTWKHLNSDFGLTVRPFYFSRIVIDPSNPDIIVKAGLNGSISKDGGKTFRDINGGVHSDLHDFWFDPNHPSTIYLGCDGGVYRSWDGGNAWEMVKGLPVSQFYQVAVDNQNPYKVYGGLQDNGSWVGVSSKPGGIENRDWIGVGFGDGFRVFPNPGDPNIVYSEMQGAEGVWRFDLKKNQSKTIKPYAQEGDPKLRFNWNTPITTSHHNPDRLYIGSQYVHKSDDRGESWTKISPDLTTNDLAKQQQANSGGLSTDNSGAENHCTIFAIGESPVDEQVLWIGTDDGNVQVTFDGGKSWSNVTANIPGLPKNTWAYFIEPSHFDKQSAYAVFDGHTASDMNPYVYKTDDGGKTWKSLVTPDIKGFCRNIREDYENKNLLFLGTEFGLFITLDGGQNWSQFTNNVPAVAVHWIAQQERDDAIVLATHGRGLIVIDNINLLRQITSDVTTQELHFLKNKTAIIHEASGYAGYSGVGEFVGENPSSAAQIAYFMKSRHTFGKMVMEIMDKDGNVISVLTPGKSKGINIVDWNYSYKRPKVAKGKTLAFGGFSSPTVPAGTYKVRITKGKNVYEEDLTLKYDPESIHSEADHVAQHETAMKLYHMNEDLAYLVDEIDNLHEAGMKLQAEPVNKKIANLLPGFIMSLEKLKEPLVVMTGDNYVGTAEPLLREKISTLYGEVVSYNGRPTEAQMQNLALLAGKLQDALKSMDGIHTQLNTINGLLSKAKKDPIKVRSKQEFLDADE